eukprot:5013667-Alexandrium_andersonii.AAC.1
MCTQHSFLKEKAPSALPLDRQHARRARGCQGSVAWQVIGEWVIGVRSGLLGPGEAMAAVVATTQGTQQVLAT